MLLKKAIHKLLILAYYKAELFRDKKLHVYLFYSCIIWFGNLIFCSVVFSTTPLWKTYESK